MKCKFCGARIKKGEEVCSKCGKFVSDSTDKITVIETNHEILSETESACEPDDSVMIFDYKKHILETLLIYVGLGLFFILIVIFSSIDDIKLFYVSASDIMGCILAILLGGGSIFRGVATYMQEKKCIITISEEKVFGTVPCGIFGTMDFDIDISNIVCIEKEDFRGKYADPKITILTADDSVEIKASSSRLLNSFKDSLRERIVK